MPIPMKVASMPQTVPMTHKYNAAANPPRKAVMPEHFYTKPIRVEKVYGSVPRIAIQPAKTAYYGSVPLSSVYRNPNSR